MTELRQITKEELTEILKKHVEWLKDISNGLRANLSDADLRGANLRGANLIGANLRCANLRGANLSDADLIGANLIGANLIGANLSDANRRCAHLRGANLSDADLIGADLRGANLIGANLDFSSGLSFRCASFDAKIDIRIGAQMAYHFCRMMTEDPEVKQAQKAIRDLANKFHRVGECGKIPDVDPK